MNGGLEVRNLHAGYNRHAAIIHGINLEVQPKQMVALLGPNGSGKSTLLKTVFGLTKLHSGSVVFQEREITQTASFRLAGLGLAYVPQQDAVFAGLNVKENLAIGSSARARIISERIEEVMAILPVLRGRSSTKAGALSGGEQRMVAIGRALMANPSMLLLDEPTAGLAPKAGAEILEQIDNIKWALGIGVLLVEQNARAAIEIADHVVVLAAGEIAFSGSRQQAVADGELVELYLGSTR